MRAVVYLFVLAPLFSAGVAAADAYDSGSTGADGALSCDEFFKQPADGFCDVAAPADGVFNLTTLYVAPGYTLRLRPNRDNTSIYILTSGDATIEGTLSLPDSAPVRLLNLSDITYAGSLGGPGAGAGGSSGPDGPSAGLGPRAGLAAAQGAPQNGGGGVGGDAFSDTNCPGSGVASSDPLWQAFAGGGGAGAPPGLYGGGGGGALTIAASGVLTVSGFIDLRPTVTNVSEGGGGSLRLVAESVRGTGQLAASNAQGTCGNGGPGLVRIEAFDIDDGLVAGADFLGLPGPGVPFAAGERPTLRISKVGGRSVVLPPAGVHPHELPSLVLAPGQPLVVEVAGSYIPPGTAVTVAVNTLGHGRQILAPKTLSGTLAASTATVTISIPAGTRLGDIEAWVDQIAAPF